MDWKELYTTFDGRLNRAPYWIGSIILGVISLIVQFIGQMMGDSIGLLVTVVVTLALLYPSICLGIKRCHDRDKSGWWMLIVLVPFIGALWYLIEFGFLRGTVGPNRFGPDPLSN